MKWVQVYVLVFSMHVCIGVQVEKFGRIDALVQAAGITGPVLPVLPNPSLADVLLVYHVMQVALVSSRTKLTWRTLSVCLL